MDARIQNLENSPSATRFSINERGIGASSAATYDANPAPSNLAIEPRRTMGTAIPAAPVGVPFFPPAAAISPHLQAQILADIFPISQASALRRYPLTHRHVLTASEENAVARER
ncbi:hypothetical protein SKAU_G00234410 [Synaphobranchus kaupii]|uniref:Uncharacterized protein n=1 Tax=Synaphobranchus kaupii TaxID=118154 RepID=A0A9Q1F6E3_SYNKA|nr:hypothetical protein SKAU_G00234410 [Synaphobranchus kaupii]